MPGREAELVSLPWKTGEALGRCSGSGRGEEGSVAREKKGQIASGSRALKKLAEHLDLNPARVLTIFVLVVHHRRGKHLVRIITRQHS
jgi:hypothetical protein